MVSLNIHDLGWREQDMEFSNPVLFYISMGLLVILPLAGILIFWRRRAELRAFGNWEAVKKLIDHLSGPKRILKLSLFFGGIFFLTLALAGPQWGSKMVEVRRKGVEVIIALDVSRSMLAEDIKPNRLQRAQQELADLIDHLKGDRVGVIAFAGSAQVACPITTDYQAAKMFLNYLTPDSITIPGTALGDAVRLAVATFPKGSEGSRVLVLLTDGEDHHSNPEAAAQEAKAAGVRILSIGFGTPGGEPIPLRDDSGRVTGYIKDAQGKSVVSSLDEKLLKQITQITDGAFWPSTSGSLESERMASLIGQMQKRDISAGQYGAYENRFQFALLPGLLFILASLGLSLRKGVWLWVFPFSLLLLAAPQVRADVGSDINQGNHAFAKKKYEQALQKYQDALMKAPQSPVVQFNLGNALHKLGKWEEAQTSYQQGIKAQPPKLQAKTWYNLGNNYFMQKKFKEAIEPYTRALQLNPRDTDAQNNLAMALRFLKKPPEPEQQKPNPKPSQNQQNQQQGQSSQKNDQEKNQNSGQYQKSEKGSGPDDRGEQKSGKAEEQGSEGQPKDTGEKAPKPGEMSAEDAANLLDAIREAEQDAQKKRISGEADKGRKGRTKVSEDW